MPSARRLEFVSSWITEGREIERRGAAAVARVLIVETTPTRINGDPLVVADIEVQAEPASYVVAMNIIVPAEQPSLSPGDLVDVMVDRDDPKRVVLQHPELIGIFYH